jgi:hypothetical protein
VALNQCVWVFFIENPRWPSLQDVALV